MKLAPAPTRGARTPAVAEPVGPVPPLRVDELGVARLVHGAATSEDAWLALVDRLPPGGAYLAARLEAVYDRAEQALDAVARGERAVLARKVTDTGPLPPSWLARLAEVSVEQLEALWALDDAVHAAAVEPRWVALDDRAVPADEASWARVARLTYRLAQCGSALVEPRVVWVRIDDLAPERVFAEGGVDAIKDCYRGALRALVTETYGGNQ